MKLRVLCSLTLLAAGALLLSPAQVEGSTIAKFDWVCSAYAGCQFTETGTGSNPYWFFGDGSSGSGSPIFHNYSQPQGYSYYFVELAVFQNGNGYDVGCWIEVYRTAVGGDPSSTSGSCG